jgi:lipopolysaccharide transport protein LptA
VDVPQVDAQKKVDAPKVYAKDENLPVMHDARFPLEFYEDGGVKAQITAKKATMLLREEGNIAGEGVVGELFAPDGTLDTRIEADECTYYKWADSVMSGAPIKLEKPGLKLTGRGFKWRIKKDLCEISHECRIVYAREDKKSGVVTSSVIAAESAVFDYGNNVATLEGDVVVVDPKVMMRSDTLVVEMFGTNELKTVVAHGNVRVLEKGMKARCDKAFYHKRKGQLRLIKDVRVKSGDDLVAGKEITLFLDEKRVVSSPGYIAIYPAKDGESKSRPSWFMPSKKRGS